MAAVGFVLAFSSALANSKESIHNDVNEPVEVWWQLVGGGAPLPGGYRDETLFPNCNTPFRPLTLSLVHQVCVRFSKHRHPGDSEKMKVCKKAWSPALWGHQTTINVSQVLRDELLPYNPNKFTPGACPSKNGNLPSSAFDSRGECTNDADHAVWKSRGQMYFDKDMSDCGYQSWGNKLSATKCMKEKEAYSDKCAACFAETISCTANHCLWQCMRSQSSACTQCVDKNCEPGFQSCSGLPSPSQLISQQGNDKPLKEPVGAYRYVETTCTTVDVKGPQCYCRSPSCGASQDCSDWESRYHPCDCSGDFDKFQCDYIVTTPLSGAKMWTIEGGWCASKTSSCPEQVKTSEESEPGFCYAVQQEDGMIFTVQIESPPSWEAGGQIIWATIAATIGFLFLYCINKQMKKKSAVADIRSDIEMLQE